MDSSMNRYEVASLVTRLIMLGTFTFFSLKYMMNALDPTKKQKKEAQEKAKVIFDSLNIRNLKTKLNEYELVVASQLIDPLSIDVSWNNIGGLESIIDDIKSQVILPLKAPYIFSTYSATYKPPTGVLLHGPPGCGKTMLAKATAREAGARFINLEVAMLTDKWYGESQKLARAVFTLAKKIQPCIIFIDEIDSFLRSRDSHDHEATAMVKAQFMTLWDGLATETDCQVLIMGATNRPRDVDKAILRRLPTMYHIGLPNTAKRKEILRAMIEPDVIEPGLELDRIAELTEEFSGSDLRELYRAAANIRMTEYAKYHPELFGFMNNASSSSSSTSSNENYSLLNGGNGGGRDDNQLRQVRIDDFISVINKMVESRRLIGVGTGQSVIGID